MPDSDLGLIRRDLESHAKTITALVEEQHKIHDALQELKTDKAVRRERDKHIEEKLTNIESLGKKVLVGFALLILASVWQFIAKGGLNVPVP